MKSELVRTILQMRSGRAHATPAVGLVPTMGSLHRGHGTLIETAREECGCVVVSIFVNPTQFNQKEDYERYPRSLDADLEFCGRCGADIVFAPEVAEMYPASPSTFVEVHGVSENLCGRFRPGHFGGVATVVAKLFQIVQPDRAYFGEKDAQQLAVIRRMVADLNMPVQIVGVPTVRESDGLALSSRNERLTPRERAAAPVLYQALRAAAQEIASGEAEPDQIKKVARSLFAAYPELQVEYFEIVDPQEMRPVERIDKPVRVAIAAWLGETRLIDNILAAP